MPDGAVIPDYQIRPSLLRRRWRLIGLVVGALSVAASWAGLVVYYSLEEPFYGDWRWDHALACSVAPLVLIGACTLWFGAVTVLVRPARLAVVLVLAASPLAAVVVRDALEIRAGYAADRARAADWAAARE